MRSRLPDIHDPDLPIQQLLTLWPACIRVFLRHRMRCVGCPIAPFHTVIDACRAHDVDEARFRADLAEAAGAG